MKNAQNQLRQPSRSTMNSQQTTSISSKQEILNELVDSICIELHGHNAEFEASLVAMQLETDGIKRCLLWANAAKNPKKLKAYINAYYMIAND